MAIYFLDVDDEITSAAARIRDSPDNRIALVLSGGSRVATSRINFRLLAREAKQRSKRLAIVTADPSVQSVARSAELPVFATVGDYERSETTLARGAVASGRPETKDALDELAMTVAPQPAGRPNGTGASRITGGPSFTNPFAGRIRVSPPFLAGAALLIVAVIAAAGFFFYPSATVVVTLQGQTLGPMTVSVSIDPNIAAANDLAGTVPGVMKEFPITASDTFQATGENVVDTAATGTVTFTNVNNDHALTVVAGTQISTAGGVQFKTTAAVVVPKASVSLPIITPGSVDAPIAAVLPGTAGNVAANTIVRVPASLSSNQVSVSNPNPTTGGAHNVTAKIQQSDIDAAERFLLSALDSNFQAALTDPASVPSGESLFPESASLGVATCNPDPQLLLDLVEPTFQLDCRATGTATMAAISGVVSLAERRARASVRSGYSMVASSLTTKVGATTHDGSTIVVPVTVEAVQVPNLDAVALKNEILGKSVDEARVLLSEYGEVEISVSPSWASSMPSFDFRVDLRLVVPALEPSPSPSIAANPEVTKRPTVPRAPTPTAIPANPTAPPSEAASASPSPTPTATPPADTPTPTDSPSPPSATPTPT